MINAYITDTITLKRRVYGTWGGATDTESTIKGRFEFKTKMTRNLQGEQVVSTANVILPLMSIEHKDKIVFESKEYTILAIERRKDFNSRFLLIYLA